MQTEFARLLKQFVIKLDLMIDIVKKGSPGSVEEFEKHHESWVDLAETGKQLDAASEWIALEVVPVGFFDNSPESVVTYSAEAAHLISSSLELNLNLSYGHVNGSSEVEISQAILKRLAHLTRKLRSVVDDIWNCESEAE